MIKTETTTNKVQCKCCNRIMNSWHNSFGRHVREHGTTLYEYAKTYYTNIGEPIKTCNFCKINEADFGIMTINHETETFSIEYPDGLSCSDIDCWNDRSLKFLGHPYDTKTFEHIGCKSEYISTRRGETIEESKFKKSKGWRENKFVSNLAGFINRYGEDEGTEKYNTRRKKIGASNCLDWYIKKFGEVEGNLRWDSYMQKTKYARKKNVSKSSKRLQQILYDLKYNLDEERYIKLTGTKRKHVFVDFYLIDYNIVIEFFGDYWHMNPNLYKATDINKHTKLNAMEMWDRNNDRINDIISVQQCNVIVVWESSKADLATIELAVNNIKNLKNTLIYI